MKPNRHFNNPVHRSAKLGFTLVEVLVSITIIIVLAFLVLAVIKRTVSNANKAVCVQNLRGIGAAIQAYTTENNGLLPGPLFGGQRARVNIAAPAAKEHRDKKGYLVNFIGEYLESGRDATAGGSAATFWIISVVPPS